MENYYSLIVAFDKNYGIGKQNSIPWKLSTDLKNFRNITLNNVIIMGRNTWTSLPIKPLKDRINIVITNSTINTSFDNTFFVKSFEEALTKAYTYKKNIYIIGGKRVYESALKDEKCKFMYISQLEKDYNCDVFFPYEYIKYYKQMSCEYVPIILDKALTKDGKEHVLNNDCNYEYKTYKRTQHNNREEQQYLDLLSDIMRYGILHKDRTGIGRISKFGCTMRFSLENNTFPLLTTKKVSFYNIVNELLWMINGQTNSKLLEEKNINIWKGNSSREYLDKNNLYHLKDGDCGPIYGFQWRNFGGKYKDCNTNYNYSILNKLFRDKINNIIKKYLNCGIDQISECIRLIKDDPHSTRIIISGWNPTQTKEMCLPACHTLYQFFVNTERKELSCSLYLRSNDLGLGCPYNIASASALVFMMSMVCDLRPYELIYTIGDAHIYSNQVEGLKLQIEREPYKFPKLKINRKVDNIFDFKYEDFELIDYKCHNKIDMKMAV